MNKILNTFFLILLTLAASCAKSPVHIAHNIPSPLVGEGQGEGASDISTPRIYFPFDSDYILPDATAGIDQNIRWLGDNKDEYIILEGHCDEVGISEYNMELGDRRARTVKAYMMEKGIPAERIIMVVSYGSTRPLNLGHRIEDLRENRRVEFVIR